MKSYKLLPFSVSILLALYATEVDCFLLNSKKAVTKVKLFSSVTPIKHGRTARTNKFDAKSNGGLIAKISCHFNTEFPEEVSTLVDYKQKVIDETEMLVVVRFHAKWCQACRAVQPRYRKLSRDFSGERIKFIECPVTEDNADLVYEGLGVPSLPFGHIYHPQAGLVEEVSINKKVFKDFERVLKYYIDGHGEVEYREDKPFTFPVEEI